MQQQAVHSFHALDYPAHRIGGLDGERFRVRLGRDEGEHHHIRIGIEEDILDEFFRAQAAQVAVRARLGRESATCFGHLAQRLAPGWQFF